MPADVLRLPWSSDARATVTIDRDAGTITVAPPDRAPATVPIPDALRAIVAAGRTRTRSDVGKAVAAGLTPIGVGRRAHALADVCQRAGVDVRQVGKQRYAPTWAVRIARMAQLPTDVRVEAVRRAAAGGDVRTYLADALSAALALPASSERGRVRNARGLVDDGGAS